MVGMDLELVESRQSNHIACAKVVEQEGVTMVDARTVFAAQRLNLVNQAAAEIALAGQKGAHASRQMHQVGRGQNQPSSWLDNPRTLAQESHLIFQMFYAFAAQQVIEAAGAKGERIVGIRANPELAVVRAPRREQVNRAHAEPKRRKCRGLQSATRRHVEHAA